MFEGDELLDAEVSASASTTVVIIRDDGTEEEITREQFEAVENDTQFEPKPPIQSLSKSLSISWRKTCWRRICPRQANSLTMGAV